MIQIILYCIYKVYFSAKVKIRGQMKRILIPSDFSENAWNAIVYGLELLKDIKCIVYLLHINPIPSYSGAGSNVRTITRDHTERLLAQSNRDLQKLLKRINEQGANPNHTFELLALYDFFTDAVKRISENKKIHLIIMGTKGATGLKKATMGSNTGNVITKIKRPLLAIPEEAVFKQIREIAFATDYIVGYNAHVLDPLLEIATMNRAEISVLHLSKQDEELSPKQKHNKRMLKTRLAEVQHDFYTLTDAKLETAVKRFTESRAIDMIAMAAKNLNSFQRILFRPKVEKISYQTKIPLLVLHE